MVLLFFFFNDTATTEIYTLTHSFPTRRSSDLVAVVDGRASIAVGVTDDLIPDQSAVDLVRVGVETLGGKGGGGRPDMAQGGGPDDAKAAAAIEAVKAARESGRASGRERVGQYVSMLVGGGALKKKKKEK